jgi:hypothetical protein
MLGFYLTSFRYPRFANSHIGHAVDRHHAAVADTDVAVNAQWVLVYGSGDKAPGVHQGTGDGFPLIGLHGFPIQEEFYGLASHNTFLYAGRFAIHLYISPILFPEDTIKKLPTLD